MQLSFSFNRGQFISRDRENMKPTERDLKYGQKPKKKMYLKKEASDLYALPAYPSNSSL